ncbi:MAG: hypothetical protein M3Z57_06800 [Candidatus Dormibacteraeota bacterium]|nr:hypothetical protein [Candidatus Dormibacteraeota bacterium]
MARLGDLTDEQAAGFGHAFLRWLTDEDPAKVTQLFPDLDPHGIDDREAGDLGRSILEDLLAERFISQREDS